MEKTIRLFILVCTLPAFIGCDTLSPFITQEMLDHAKDRDGDGVPNELDCAPDDASITTFSFWHDHDGDGYGAGEPVTGCVISEGLVDKNGDCNDSNKAVHPGAKEICDGIDNDCNQKSDDDDEGLDPESTFVFYADGDNDGYGNVDLPIHACLLPIASTDNSIDCDDGNPKTHPGATETCDHIDNDCNGQTDEGLTSHQYLDQDEDGFGDPNVSVDDCPKNGYVGNNLDCDDAHAKVNPTAIEVCDGVDNDCNNQIDEGLTGIWYKDQDKDGYGNPFLSYDGCPKDGYVDNNLDCSDANPKIHPDAEEVCDTLDNNCDGQTDEGVTAIWYADGDTDGFGNPNVFYDGCPKSGYVSNNLDCDDTHSKVNPAATEVCDGIDNDCNGATDENLLVVQYLDQDKDGYGTPNVSIDDCPTSGYVLNDLDCNDTKDQVHPGVTEVCDHIDNDCNGQTDEGVTVVQYFDQDKDGYGDPNLSINDCPKTGYVTNNLDCDDAKIKVSPNATEICDGLDNDCNGQTDEGFVLLWYLDADHDLFGRADISQNSCTQPKDYVQNNLDCNDFDAKINPNAVEICDDGIDQDCNGIIDDAKTATRWYADTDADDAGDSASFVYACKQPPSRVANHDDCNDQNPSISPYAQEACNDGIDNNCDGQTDENPVDVTWYQDADKDGFGNVTVTQLACAPPPGYVGNDADCDDENKDVHPGVAEMCNNGIDDNCDGSVNECVLQGVIDLTTPTVVRLQGSAANEFGSTFAVCDVDGDGSNDLIVSEPHYAQTGHLDQGKVSVYLGPLQNPVGTPTHELIGNDGDLLGTSIACSPAVPGAWVAIGASGRKNDVWENAGAVFVFMGTMLASTSPDQADILYVTEMTGAALGSSCLFVPDQDGDTHIDLFVGAEGFINPANHPTGASLLFSTASIGTHTVSDAIAVATGTQNGDLIGHTIAVGSLGAGNPFVFVTSGYKHDTSAPDVGIVYIKKEPFVGTASLQQTSETILTGPSGYDQAGYSLCLGQNITGTLATDLVIGLPGGDIPQKTGEVHIVHAGIAGNISLLNNEVGVYSVHPGDHLGTSVSCGDLNKDGFGDVFVGAPGFDTTKADAGKAFVIYGPLTQNSDVENVAQVILVGENGSDRLGWVSAIVDDLTADANPDLIVVTKGTTTRTLYVIPGLSL